MVIPFVTSPSFSSERKQERKEAKKFFFSSSPSSLKYAYNLLQVANANHTGCLEEEGKSGCLDEKDDCEFNYVGLVVAGAVLVAVIALVVAVAMFVYLQWRSRRRDAARMMQDIAMATGNDEERQLQRGGSDYELAPTPDAADTSSPDSAPLLLSSS